jgi:hypothetical protein
MPTLRAIASTTFADRSAATNASPVGNCALQLRQMRAPPL